VGAHVGCRLIGLPQDLSAITSVGP
jgi:hypothetical protein